MSTLSKNLKMLIAKRKIRMASLSRKTGISPPVINRLVNGITTNPNVDTLRPIAHYFNISISQLVGDAQLPEKNSPYPVAIIAWDHVLEWQQHQPQQRIINYAYTEYPLPKNAFAVQFDEDSMEPVFAKGSLLIVNPDITPQDREHIIASVEQQKPLFKQILLGHNTIHLASHHPDHQIINAHNMNTIGVVVETRLSLPYPTSS